MYILISQFRDIMSMVSYNQNSFFISLYGLFSGICDILEEYVFPISVNIWPDKCFLSDETNKLPDPLL